MGKRRVIRRGNASGSLVSVVVLALLLSSAPAAAVEGPFAHPGTLPRQGYEVRLAPSFHYANRDDFSRLMLLFPRFLAQLEAWELQADLELRLSLVPDLAVLIALPVRVRQAQVQTQALVVSNDEVIPARSHELDGYGLGDSTLAAGYRVRPLSQLEAYLDLGTTIPLDDNPGSTTFPTRLPLGTGQTEFFASLGAHLNLAPVTSSLEYRYSYFPGNGATYLVRRVANQSFANGSLDAFEHHRATARVALALDDRLSVALRPRYTARVAPVLNQRDGSAAVIPEVYIHEFSVRLEASLKLGEDSELQLYYTHAFLDSWNVDPFFPLLMPERGFGLSWRTADY